MFQANFSGEVTANVVVISIFSIYRTSQLVMLEYSVRLRLEVPTVYPYSALFSHSAGVLAQACQHVLLTSLDEDWSGEGLYLSTQPCSPMSGVPGRPGRP